MFVLFWCRSPDELGWQKGEGINWGKEGGGRNKLKERWGSRGGRGFGKNLYIQFFFLVFSFVSSCFCFLSFLANGKNLLRLERPYLGAGTWLKLFVTGQKCFSPYMKRRIGTPIYSDLASTSCTEFSLLHLHHPLLLLLLRRLLCLLRLLRLLLLLFFLLSFFFL